MKKMSGNWVGERRPFNPGEGHAPPKSSLMNANGKSFEEKGWYKGHLHIYACGKTFIITFLKSCSSYSIKQIIFKILKD